LIDQMPKCADYESVYQDLDPDGEGLDLDAFKSAVQKLNFKVDEKDIPVLFKRFKLKEEKKNPKVSPEEFFKFCLVEATAAEAEAGANLEKYSSMFGLMGPIEAAHGFTTALAVLSHKPSLASVLWTPPDTHEGVEGFLPRPEKVGGWPPLHMLLVAGEVSPIIKDQAPPLIQALLKHYPEAAAVRVQQELSILDGCLPLYLAIQCGWDHTVVKMIADKYANAKTSLDLKTSGKGKAPSLKNSVWARKIAEDCAAAPEVIAMMPKPTKAKKKELDAPGVIGGFKWEMVTDA